MQGCVEKDIYIAVVLALYFCVSHPGEGVVANKLFPGSICSIAFFFDG
jgi:hypothetical protein